MTATHPHQLTSAEDAHRFVLAGNATFTVVSKATGTRFTYKVNVSDKPDLYFVALMNGPDNEGSFAYLGTIGNQYFKHGVKSKISADAPSARAFSWIWANLKNGKLPDTVEFWHQGKCCRCGRKLTVPSSIESGWGPECSRIVGAS